MAVPLLTKKIVKKRVKKFKRPQSDRKISVKVYTPTPRSDLLVLCLCIYSTQNDLYKIMSFVVLSMVFIAIVCT